MSIIVLVHDIGWNGLKNVDRNMVEYKLFHKKFADKKIPYSAAVIPAVIDYDMREWMKDNFYNGVTTILHGWNHEDRIFDGKSDEFGGRSVQEKRKRIELGFKWLARLKPKGFCAPFNRYDDELVSACHKASLRYFFGGYGREKTEVYEEKFGTILIPVDECIYFRGQSYRKYIEVLKNLPDREQPYVATFHCTWEFPNLEFPEFDEMLDVIKSKGIISVETIKKVVR